MKNITYKPEFTAEIAETAETLKKLKAVLSELCVLCGDASFFEN
jgi:hypothetical protein